MKKVIALLLCIAMVLSLGACGSTSQPAAEQPKSEAAAASSAESEAPAPTEAAEAASTASSAEEASEAAENTGDIAWPEGKVTVFVPGEAGNPVDLSARCWTSYLSEYTGCEYEIVNDPTGDGERLFAQLNKADPDGLTFLYGGVGQGMQFYAGLHALNPLDPANYTVVCTGIGLNKGGDVLFTQPDAPYNDIYELADYVKEHPGEVTCALSSGTTRYIVTVTLLRELGIYDDLRIVEATAPEVTSGLLGGTINLGAMGDQFAPQYLADNSLKALVLMRKDRDYDAYITPEDKPAMDAIPTYADYGLEKCYYLFPMLVYGPPAMSDELCEKIASTMAPLAEEDTLVAIQEQLGGSNSYTNYTHAEAVQIAADAKEAVEQVLLP